MISTRNNVLNDDKAFAWLRLFLAADCGTVHTNRLYVKALTKNLAIEDIFELDRKAFTKIFSPHQEKIYLNLNQQPVDDFKRLYSNLKADKIEIVHFEHPLYPNRLKNLYLEKAPSLLFAKGRLDLLNSAGIAIVGSRNVDENGLKISTEVAITTAKCGFNINSGYARGVDTAAHIGALKAEGTTTFILGYGIKNFTVKKDLSEFDWKKSSLILSQFPPSDVWKNYYGMIRNELIVGLSSAVIVISADDKSGTMNTGNLALKNGIPLFVLSPDFFKKAPVGNLKLIDKGGIAINHLDDLPDHLDNADASFRRNIESISTSQGKLPL